MKNKFYGNTYFIKELRKKLTKIGLFGPTLTVDLRKNCKERICSVQYRLKCLHRHWINISHHDLEI